MSAPTTTAPPEANEKKHGSSASSDLEDQNDSSIIGLKDRSELGAEKAQIIAKVWGKYSVWVLYISLGLAAYIYSLDNGTTWLYGQFATSSFQAHSLLSTVGVVTQVVIAIGKPVIARISDLQSRVFAYTLVLISYLVGYVLIATSHNIPQYAAGAVFQAIGQTGLQLLTTIVIADFTSLKWRALVSGLMSAPYIVNAFVGSKISASITTHDPVNGWRWGYGMFTILVPVTILPLIITLAWASREAKKRGLTLKKKSEVEKLSITAKAIRFVHELDLVGLLLLGFGVGLILISITLSGRAKGGWNNPSIIAMLAVGPIILILFGLYESFLAKHPVLPRSVLANRSIIGASLIGFFDFVSFYLTFLYLSSFLYVMKTPQWSQSDQNYFGSTQTVGLTVSGIVGGLIMSYTHRYKTLLIVGLFIRLLGVGIMIHSRGANGSDGELVITQILQSFGGGFAVVTAQTAAQASVPHSKVAMATAIPLLITEIGGAIGSAIAGGIWGNLMPKNLAKYIPAATPEEIQALYASTITIVGLDPSDPIRIGAIHAYSDTMLILIVVATVFSVFPIAVAFIMPNWYLGDAQNAIDLVDIRGEKTTDKAI